MEWKDIAKTVGANAPLLGTILAGPAGGALGSIIASALRTGGTPDDVAAAIDRNPEAAITLRQIEAADIANYRQMAADQAKAEMAAAVQAAEAVNKTMQSEAASEHWPTYSWRPAIGFAMAFNIVASSVLVIGVFGALVFNWPGAAVAVAALPATLGALAAITGLSLPVVGIASYFRGKMQSDPSIPTENKG